MSILATIYVICKNDRLWIYMQTLYFALHTCIRPGLHQSGDMRKSNVRICDNEILVILKNTSLRSSLLRFGEVWALNRRNMFSYDLSTKYCFSS